MESNDRVRKNIRALRKYYGETMLDLSIALNVSKSLISDWENGKKQISHNSINKIAKHYRIPSSIIINDDLSDIDNWSAPCQVDRKIIKVYDEFLWTRLFIYAGIFNPIDKVILFLL